MPILMRIARWIVMDSAAYSPNPSAGDQAPVWGAVVAGARNQRCLHLDHAVL
jgi:hypothetical protein